jgi:two-component system NarL family response regulator
MKILIVDDHVLFREGLASLLNNQPGYTVVGEADSAREAIEKTIELEPDLVLLEILLQDGYGIEVIKEILKIKPEIRIIALTNNDSKDLFFLAIRNGAFGYLLKRIPLSKLLLSINAIEKGEAALSRTMTSQLVGEFQRIAKTDNNDLSSKIDALTPRELEVLQLLSINASNQDIANYLTIAENTVKVHVRNLLEKLKFHNRHQAGRFTRRHGIEHLNNKTINS